ncbi:hypothetical protein O181_020876 [Austropuccinia psidii MF-1]|uniref:Uncharacterized protein n=1 Tax=Austropuccinia psidii MF-1 TaxID=1389203 RepID=A0A9Q3CEC3_9BASI|nr:hypothetical protein [Austropuccinia psidii MF-1]
MWNKPEERTGLFRFRRSGFGKHGEWKDAEVNSSHTPVHLPIKQRPQTRVLDSHGSSTSSPPTSERPFPVEHETKDVQSGFKLRRTRGKLPEDLSQRNFFQRPYGDYQTFESQ